MKDIKTIKAEGQHSFDTIIKDVLKLDARLSIETWNSLFELFNKAESEGLNLDVVSPVTKMNYSNWKKRNNI